LATRPPRRLHWFDSHGRPRMQGDCGRSVEDVQTRRPAAALGERPALRNAWRRCAPWKRLRRTRRGGVCQDRLQSEPGTATNEWAVISIATTRLAYRRRLAARHWTCSSSVGKPRSTPEWACFITFSAAMPTSAAREVTFYLALALPPSPFGFVSSSSPVLRRARRRFSAEPVRGPFDHCSECRSVSRNWWRSSTTEIPASIT
jgi:hypothetical protein